MKSTTTIILAVVITAIVAGAVGYIAAPPAPASGQTTVTVTSTTTTTAPTGEQALKVGFMYIGPIEGSGWNLAFERGREYIEDRYSQVETVVFEDVIPADVPRVIETMIEQDVDLIFSTAFDFIVDTAQMAEQYPDTMFYVHLESREIMPFLMGEGYTSPSNLGYYFACMDEPYYLDGLISGALTQTDKLGFLLPFALPETLRYLDAYGVGAREVNPDVEIKVILLGSWFDPPTEALATTTLVDWGADIVNSYMDTPAYVQAAQKIYDDTGERILAFSVDTPFEEYGPDVVISGQMYDRTRSLEDLVVKALHGYIETGEHNALMAEGGAVWGMDWDTQINPDMLSEVEAATVNVPAIGEMNLYDLLQLRYGQFIDVRKPFDIFKGPLRDSDGVLRIAEGDTMSPYEFWVTLDWYVEGIIPPE